MVKTIFHYTSAFMLAFLLAGPLFAQMPTKAGEPIKLDTTVNSLYEEIMPLIAPDKKTLYFVRSLSAANTGGKEAGQDVWFSTMMADGKWSRPFNLGLPINNESNNAVCGIADDGNTLYLTNIYKSKKMEPGISYTKKVNGIWSQPVAIDIQELNIQRGYLGGFMCPDQKTLFLTMKSDDAVGREDIYVSTKNADGTWAKPKTLGRPINTVGFEISPFYNEADSMLYFASNGHEGYGDADMFRSKRLDASFTRWSKPENLGSQVNGDGFDAYLSIAYDSTVFFAKENPEVRFADLYSVILIDPTKKAKADSLAKALAKNAAKQGTKTKKDKDGNGVDDADDKFGKNDVRPEYEIMKELNDRKRLVNNAFESILFDFGSTKLRKESKVILDRAVTYLKEHPSQAIEFVGHTDSVDNELVNQILSDKRAYAAKEYLIRKGISRNKILTHGFGKQIYVSDNSTDRGRQRNRRCEANVLVDPEEFKAQYQNSGVDIPGEIRAEKTPIGQEKK